MCDQVICEGLYIDTVGELKQVVDKIVPIGGELDGDNFCLCNVDLIATATTNGLKYKHDDNGDVVYIKY